MKHLRPQVEALQQLQQHQEQLEQHQEQLQQQLTSVVTQVGMTDQEVAFTTMPEALAGSRVDCLAKQRDNLVQPVDVLSILAQDERDELSKLVRRLPSAKSAVLFQQVRAPHACRLMMRLGRLPGMWPG